MRTLTKKLIFNDVGMVNDSPSVFYVDMSLCILYVKPTNNLKVIKI